jgi:hypothetical protein
VEFGWMANTSLRVQSTRSGPSSSGTPIIEQITSTVNLYEN